MYPRYQLTRRLCEKTLGAVLYPIKVLYIRNKVTKAS